MKVIVFGAGNYGRKYISNCPDNIEIVAICDNRWNNFPGGVLGHKISSPKIIPEMEFDKIMIALNPNLNTTLESFNQIYSQLTDMGIGPGKICLTANDNPNLEGTVKYGLPRVQFLYDFAEFVYSRGLQGSAAELGVYKGDYAYHINKAFYDRRLYLFDSFERFSESQLEWEEEHVKDILSSANKNLSVQIPMHEKIALAKCIYKDNVIIRKGFVPDTLEGMPEDRYVYINLDMDIYVPTIAALEYFAPRMNEGGVIAVQDYGAADGFFTGVRRAVKEFIDANSSVRAVPIGDGTTLLLIF